jgi:anti-sigma regulatory factor (Ser/Thr protein kinase)
LQLITKIQQNVPQKVYSDTQRYKQVLFNLIGNAIKFTFEGSIQVHVSMKNGILITEVIDTGIGMKNEDLQRLFKFFGKLQMTKMINRGGMGLGLTISKMIVQELGGDITVSSTQGQGSTFTFSIKTAIQSNTHQLQDMNKLIKEGKQKRRKDAMNKNNGKVNDSNNGLGHQNSNNTQEEIDQDVMSDIHAKNKDIEAKKGQEQIFPKNIWEEKSTTMQKRDRGSDMSDNQSEKSHENSLEQNLDDQIIYGKGIREG